MSQNPDDTEVVPPQPPERGVIPAAFGRPDSVRAVSGNPFETVSGTRPSNHVEARVWRVAFHRDRP